MAPKSDTKSEKTNKKGSTKKTDNSKDMTTLKGITDGAVNFVNKVTGKTKNKVGEKKENPVAPITDNNIPAVEHQKGILPAVENNSPTTEIGEGTLSSKNEVKEEQKGILPINDVTPASTPKAEKDVKVKETKKTKSKFFSDFIFEIKTDIATFMGNTFTVTRGVKIHRVEEQKFLFSWMELQEGTTEYKPAEALVPDSMEEADKAALLALPNWYDIFQKELDAYEASLKSEAKAQSLIPKPKVGVDPAPPIHAPQVEVKYATAGVNDMLSYGDLIYNQLMNSAIVRIRKDKFTAIEVENNLKKETSLYKLELKFDQKNRGWYIDMSQGNNFVRIPKDPTLFLPIK
jgi:hypothetical protein